MTAPRTRAQAVAAAEAMGEARRAVDNYCGGRQIMGNGLDRKLYRLERRYWKLADELGGKGRKSR